MPIIIIVFTLWKNSLGYLWFLLFSTSDIQFVAPITPGSFCIVVNTMTSVVFLMSVYARFEITILQSSRLDIDRSCDEVIFLQPTRKPDARNLRFCIKEINKRFLLLLYAVVTNHKYLLFRVPKRMNPFNYVLLYQQQPAVGHFWTTCPLTIHHTCAYDQ